MIPPENIFNYHYYEHLPYFAEFNKLMMNGKKFVSGDDELEIVHLSYRRPKEWVVFIYENSRKNKSDYNLICNVSDSSGLVTMSFDYPENRIKYLKKCKVNTFTKRLSLFESQLIVKAYRKMIYETKQVDRVLMAGSGDDEYYSINGKYAMHNKFTSGEKCGLLWLTSRYLMEYSYCKKDREQYYISKIFDNCYRILASPDENVSKIQEETQPINNRGLTYLAIVSVTSLLSLIIISSVKGRLIKRK